MFLKYNWYAKEGKRMEFIKCLIKPEKTENVNTKHTHAHTHTKQNKMKNKEQRQWIESSYKYGGYESNCNDNHFKCEWSKYNN